MYQHPSNLETINLKNFQAGVDFSKFSVETGAPLALAVSLALRQTQKSPPYATPLRLLRSSSFSSR
jgi:hypothetical protein